MKKINVVYFGSPDFSAQILDSLCKLEIENCKFRIAGVITTPDKPQGRRQILTPSPVTQIASKHDLPVFKPTKLDDANLSHLKLLSPDIFLVVSYGKIIPKNWLTAPKIGTFNLHFSLLPKYRNSLCISEAIRNQDLETGVTLMIMDDKLDHGPIITQQKISIDINDNCQTLTDKLTRVGSELLSQYLPLIATKKFRSTSQDHSRANYTPKIITRNRQSAFIPWDDIQRAMSNKQYALTTHALIRSLNPDPGAWTKIPVSSSQDQVSSEIEVKIIKTKLDTRYLILDTIQLPGKTPISWKQFISGYPS